MRYLLTCVVLVALLLGTAYAQGQFAIAYTAEQLEAAKWAAARYNADNGTSLTTAEYAALVFQSAMDDWVNQRAAEAEQNASIRDQYLALSDADKALVDAYITNCTANGCS